MNLTELWVMIVFSVSVLGWVVVKGIDLYQRSKVLAERGRAQLARDSPTLSADERRQFEGIIKNSKRG